MTAVENEMKQLQNEVRGLRRLLLERDDPDAGRELTDTIKKRILTARNSTVFLSAQDILQQLEA